jgi:ribosomal protein S13
MDFMEQIFPAHWLPLSHEMREHLAKVFGVGRSASTEIVDNRIVSDGRSVSDLSHITKEKMQEYVNDKEESFSRLWELVQSKALGELNPPKELIPEHVVVPTSVVDEPVKKEVNPFRTPTKKEADVIGILTKNANGKVSKKK